MLSSCNPWNSVGHLCIVKLWHHRVILLFREEQLTTAYQNTKVNVLAYAALNAFFNPKMS